MRVQVERRDQRAELVADAAFERGIAGQSMIPIGNKCSGLGERRQTTLRHLNVPASLPLEIALTGAERWVGGAIA